MVFLKFDMRHETIFNKRKFVNIVTGDMDISKNLHATLEPSVKGPNTPSDNCCVPKTHKPTIFMDSG